jgi:hypothetical protein
MPKDATEVRMKQMTGDTCLINVLIGQSDSSVCNIEEEFALNQIKEGKELSSILIESENIRKTLILGKSWCYSN